MGKGVRFGAGMAAVAAGVLLWSAVPASSQAADEDVITVTGSATCRVQLGIAEWVVTYEARNELSAPEPASVGPAADDPGAADATLSGSAQLAGGAAFPVTFDPATVGPGGTTTAQFTLFNFETGALTLDVDWFVAGQDRSGTTTAPTIQLGSCPAGDPGAEGAPTPTTVPADPLASPAAAAALVVEPAFTG